MAILLDQWQIILVFCVAWVAWRFLRHRLTKSPLDNIPGPPSSSFWKGNIPQLFDRHKAWSYHKALGNSYGPVVRFTQMFGKPALYVFDPVALHSVVVKNQYIYERAPFQIAINELMLGPGILSTKGDHHRMQRKSLNPVFSIVHMRYLTPIFYETMHRLRMALLHQIKGSSGEVDILIWMGRAALELIGQGGLGYSFDPLVEDMKDSYGHALKTMQPALSKSRLWVLLSPYYRFLGPAWFRRFLARLVPDPHFQRLRSVTDIMDASSRSIFAAKKEALLRGDEAVEDQVGRGKDILSILLKANIQAVEEDRLPDDEVLGQMSTFVLAAMDTTSNALSHILQLLAEHPEVQEKLRKEITDARNGQDISYDHLVDLPYLDAVCRESLRLYPPVAISHREAVEDVVMPLSEPIQGLDGNMVREILVPRGTLVVTGNWMCNTNKALWGDDADEWKPERWLSPAPDALKQARIPGVYSNLMTFLGGGRACIGFKFSQLEMKVVLCVLLESFRFYPSDKPIFWNFTNIAFPTVGKNDPKPSLPLRVEAICMDDSWRRDTA